MRLILLLLSYNITYNYIIHQHRVTVQSYALNPRAMHPNGKVPSIAKAGVTYQPFIVIYSTTMLKQNIQ